MKIIVFTTIGENCIALEDGQKIYDVVHPEILAGRTVELDFKSATVFATPFFNAALGQLLKDIPPGQLNHLLSITNMVPTGANILKRVIENARQYYSDPAHKAAVDSVVGERSKDSHP